jgi:hypothetical protein
MLIILGINSTSVDLVTFTSIRYSSVVLEGSATPPNITAGSVVSSTSALSSSLASANLGGFPVTQTTIVSNGVDSSSSKNNTPLIIGLAVGIPLLISNFIFIQ